MIESNADRLSFFNPQEFGVSVKLTSSSSGVESDVYGIFDSQYFNLDLGVSAVSSSDLQFTCRTADVCDYTQGDQLTLNSVTYEIIDVQEDGTGITVLKLHKV